MTKKIAILTALQTEAHPVLDELLQKKLERKIRSMRFYSGELPQIKSKIIFGICGIGKVQAAMATQFIVDTFSPDHIFLIGACGGATKGVNPGDILIPTKTIQSDFDTTCFGDERGEFQGPVDTIKYKEFETDRKMKTFLKKKYIAKYLIRIEGKKPIFRYGNFVSQDCFETDKKKLENVEKEFSCIGFDMEAAAVNIVSAMNNVPCNVIKGVLDSAGEFDIELYKKYIHAICANSYQVLRIFLETM
jgi:adenosylhomocysteine nucleosidase